jgi:hypothetical protein
MKNGKYNLEYEGIVGWTYGGKLPSKYVIHAKIDKFDAKATAND